jgi:hypothetical protein
MRQLVEHACQFVMRGRGFLFRRDAAFMKIFQKADVAGLRYGKMPRKVAPNARALVNSEASFEMTKIEGSSPWAIMAFSTSGSFRMKLSSNAPTEV